MLAAIALQLEVNKSLLNLGDKGGKVANYTNVYSLQINLSQSVWRLYLEIQKEPVLIPQPLHH